MRKRQYVFDGQPEMARRSGPFQRFSGAPIAARHGRNRGFGQARNRQFEAKKTPNMLPVPRRGGELVLGIHESRA